MGLDELEITHAGRIIFRDVNDYEISFQGTMLTDSDIQQDNDQENTQVSLDDMINESVDVYERRRDGESDATYEDVDVHFNREHERTIGLDMNHEVTGNFTVDATTLRDATGDIGAFTLNEDFTTATFAQGLNLTEMEERVTCLENEVYGNNPEIDSILMRVGNLEAYLASTDSLVERLIEYLQNVIYDVQDLQDRAGVDISQYPTLENVVQA